MFCSILCGFRGYSQTHLPHITNKTTKETEYDECEDEQTHELTHHHHTYFIQSSSI